MQRILTVFILSFSFSFYCFSQETPYETSKYTETATYDQAIQFYKELEQSSELVKIREYGQTDAGKQLHLVVISGTGTFRPDMIRKQDKRILLINNAIHAGEPCGVDASMMLARDLVTEAAYQPLLQNVVVCIIPVYNIGGALNRGCCSRANQVGPVEYGFRGNSRNLDLNRDFIKADSRNAFAFTQLFHEWQPDVFVDNHTTNGADYPYVMTLIASQKDKFDPGLAEYLEQAMLPELYRRMEETDYKMCPYVNSVSGTPDNGISDFLDLPRYSMGYTGLFNTLSFTSEAHMLKPFEQRVEGTYLLMMSLIKTINRDRVQIGRLRKQAAKNTADQETFGLRWTLDTTRVDKLKFKGYAAKYKPSTVSGYDRLYYDRNEGWEKEIDYFRTYSKEVERTKPRAYIIPQAWKEAIERLTANGVKMKRLKADAVIKVEEYLIESYETTQFPYEGHYLHYNTAATPTDFEMQFRKGDYVVFTGQDKDRYIVSVLEPEGNDSYFNWNMFDEILFQKEYFSSYVFEETAAEILARDPELKAELEAARQQDTVLAGSARDQLNFIYKRSEYFEPAYRRYPVARWNGKGKVDLE